MLPKFLEPLHLMLGISYYKIYVPPKIKIPYLLTKDQADFWNTVYRKGLGEFLYSNALDPKRIATFPWSRDVTPSPVRLTNKPHVLLGIGGGKDSIVAHGLLKDYTVASFLVETQKKDPISLRVASLMGNKKIFVKRTLDTKLFTRYLGSYNGHIPISAVFAFLGITSAAFVGYKYVAVGNERSSNVGNIDYHGEVINHQWSKSSEFETLFQDYCRKYITPDITYFALLRQFHELRIAKMFSQHKEFLSTFASCNRNFKVFKGRQDHLWCGECPKCAFVFLVLSPFIPKKNLIKIFGKNLFADEKLLPLFNDLLGFGKMKPFECVGTFEENKAALFLSAPMYPDDIIPKTLARLIKKGNDLVAEMMKTYSATTLPTPFRLLGVESVGILGYGIDGKASEEFIRKKYPKVRISILDQALDAQYLKRQEDVDLIIKTPGIPKEKVTRPYVTAANLFFSHVKGMTIGITGTKGKSTTSSLIYAILKTAKKKVNLIGNIGTPMLGVLLKNNDPRQIHVLELSSYMLDDIEYSPNIALLLNLFPEHMTYHGGVKQYYAAKQNIFAFQREGDVAIKWPFSIRIPLQEKEIQVRGQHNMQNVQAAILVARELGISDTVIKQALRTFKPLSHRLEFVGTYKGIEFYDDAISTTPESTIAALQTITNVDTIFLGGEDRGYDFKNLEKVLRKSKIRNIVLFPDTGKRILSSTKGFNSIYTKSMKEAVEFAFTHTKPGKSCLLSTASPSYSVWKNFEEKGDIFKKLVKELGSKK
jgi:UDP-N-acetylmuramoylalanine--D-glutamate ligase